MTFKDVCRALRDGKYTSVGSYPTFFLASDGGALSHEAVRENIFLVGRSMRDFNRPDKQYRYSDPAWRIVDCGINWEDSELYCSNTGERIESAYAEDQAAS